MLTNTTIVPSVPSDTAAVKIIHSISATSAIFAWSISTIVDIFRTKSDYFQVILHAQENKIMCLRVYCIFFREIEFFYWNSLIENSKLSNAMPL